MFLRERLFENMANVKFKIQCPVDKPAPDEYARQIYEHAGREYSKPLSRFFETWVYTVEVELSDYDDFCVWLKEKMQYWYDNGLINYACWGRVGL